MPRGWGVMPLILLLLGVVTTIAGAVLVASGLTFHDGTFDTEAITPGTVAAIGGLLLIGMGLAVRELQRIERALAARPMPRTSRAGDGPVNTAKGIDPSVRVPFPSKSKTSAQAASVDARSRPARADEAAVEPLLKFPTLPGREEGPVAEENSVEVRQPAVATAMAGRGANGASPARVAPRFDIKPRAAVASDTTQGSGVAAFLSGKSRRDGQGASAQTAAAIPHPGEKPAPETQSAPVTPTGAVSVLKSGVVEGMAYTLYSDGSIEAQLPQGTLRFGSITALREHIDSGA